MSPGHLLCILPSGHSKGNTVLAPSLTHYPTDNRSPMQNTQVQSPPEVHNYLSKIKEFKQQTVPMEFYFDQKNKIEFISFPRSLNS